MPAARVIARLDRQFSPPMVTIALLMLSLTAGAIPQLEQDLFHDRLVTIARQSILLIWPVIVAEMLLRLVWLERGCRTAGRITHLMLVALAPPLRITLSPFTARRCIWIPLLGWRRMGRPLYRRLEDAFSVPMLIIALLILPALLLEWALHKDLLNWPKLGLALDIASRAIWFAFALELVVMLSTTHRKGAYALSHWIDVAIVIIPIVPFLGVVRILRLGETLQATRLIQMTRVYRLRALALRGWRGLLLIKGLERYSVWSAEKRLAHLKRQLAKRLEDLDELKERITLLESHLEQARGRRECGTTKSARETKSTDADGNAGEMFKV